LTFGLKISQFVIPHLIFSDLFTVCQEFSLHIFELHQSFYSFIPVVDFDIPVVDGTISVFHRNMLVVDRNYAHFATRHSDCRPEIFPFQSERFCRRPEDFVSGRQYPCS
jgi:hypothetical protein